MNQLDSNLKFLLKFVGRAQLDVMQKICDGEESAFMEAKIDELVGVIKTMPKSYETDDQGQNAVVYLHYFLGGMDWHITEKDREEDQFQAFGLANLGYGGELGYISIDEITSCGAEIDLYWTAKKLSEVNLS